MEQGLLENRYEFTKDGKAIIDISVESMNDLFNSFDKKATFVKRELDQDFVDYIIDSVKEVGDSEFLIRVSIDQEYNMLQENILRKAVANYFSYLYQIENRNLRKEMRKFSLLGLLGVVLFTMVYLYKLPDTPEIELWKKIFQEGVVVAAWVAIWEAVTSLIFGWNPYYLKRGIYERIATAEFRVVNNLLRFEY
ncbi:MAG: hypothetical protein CVV41_10155 [Candidatus Riflebacteria bacterium HGW-Riflebacteria-1]|jgi:hypothetical protein|nr:MAG: hypothetical protein CVV41_10155 [Candidatus Riflebacteria bacterium HGW-Riflebacteria-1]